MSENLVKMLTAECQLERFLVENPPNEKNVDVAATELPSIQQELLKVAAAHPKVCSCHIMEYLPKCPSVMWMSQTCRHARTIISGNAWSLLHNSEID